VISAILAAVWLGYALPGRGADRAPLRPDQPPLFTADALISIDSLGRPSLGVTVSVPYSELQWAKLEKGYGAGVEFTVMFEPRNKTRVYGDLWERRVAVQSFSQTHSANPVLEERRTFDVPPGRYTARVQVRDLEAEQISTATSEIEVPDYSKLPVGFSQLELGLVDSTGAFTPVPSRRFGTTVNRLAARVTLFDRRQGNWPRRYPLHFRIRDLNGEELGSRIREVELQKSGQPVIVGPSDFNLFVGSYTVEVELSEGKSRWSADRTFEVEESGPPRGREFERMLEPLSYIAEAKEIERLRNLAPEDQERGWEEFWRRRDPTPETVRNEAMIEFFRRVRYAEQHFQGFGPGWRSDMGRIYIRFGPPDQIETRPATVQSPQTEIWYYSQPYRRLIFVDREGFGRFTLTNPDTE
jgi:GWxTD domain-containing protein